MTFLAKSPQPQAPRSVHRRPTSSRAHRVLCVEGLERREALSVTILGADGREVVNQPSQGLFRAAGKLEIWFPRNQNPTLDNADGSCSGVMISRRHVLTAAHCFYDPQNPGPNGSVGPQANVIAFTAARQGKFGRPYGTAFAVNLRTYNTFRNSQDSTVDVALVTLDRNLGDTVGWYGASAFNDSSYPRGVNVLGYPGVESGRFDGYTMIHQFDQAFISQSNDRFLRSSTIESEGGQSGGPWFNYNSETEEVRVLGVMRGGDPSAGRTYGVRLTNDMIDDFRDAIDADLAGQSGGGGSGRGFAGATVNPGGSTSTVDLPDLADYDQWFDAGLSSVSTTFLQPGDFFGATAWVQNTGTADSGPFVVSFFASPDPNIDPFDAFLGSVQVNFAGQFQSAAASLATAFPSLPPGSYFIGWAIDTTNAVAEFNESNNVGLFRGGPVTVASPNLGPTAMDDAFEVEQGGVLDVPFPGVLENDFDPDGFFLEAFVVDGPSHGTLDFQPSGAFVYTPDPDYQGPDFFTYRAGDGKLLSDLATVALDVFRVNAAPLVLPDEATTQQGLPLLIDVLTNDSDEDGQLDPQSVEIATPPESGAVNVQADGRILFEPAEDFSGEATFTYTVADDQGLRSHEAVVVIAVEAAYAWQNADAPFDVNDNGSIDIGDLVLVVQYLRTDKPRMLEHAEKDEAAGFIDVNGDRQASIADLIEVLAAVRVELLGNGEEGERESVAVNGRAASPLLPTAYDFLAVDIARRQRSS